MYTSSLHQNTDLISQNVLQMYFFCRNNIDLKHTSSSVIQQVEVYSKYTWSILEVYLKFFFFLNWDSLHARHCGISGTDLQEKEA